MTTVSVCVEDEMLAQARRYGINVSEALRQGLAAEIRKAHVRQNVSRLSKLAQEPTTSAVDQLRGLRDGRRA
ncbi:MAG TPA: type II toxin-antitoxin system CcdA family antitoxin [Candidatus Thermoplasmatota archaeon]|nr:type II toxin-antitoxin system CcdA family antitoxin [Candidatus Thermoplasmatota archaeon]